jgi:hypothetical protein
MILLNENNVLNIIFSLMKTETEISPRNLYLRKLMLNYFYYLSIDFDMISFHA